jgi:tetratricopeptide (TPR) repeat protein
VAPSTSPSDALLERAIATDDPERRERWARQGLELDDDRRTPDTEFLLWRQLYLAHAERDRWREAVTIAERMTRIGPFADLAHNDRSRAFSALGDARAAIDAQRSAVATAPKERRAFQGFFLATLLHFAGDIPEALDAIAKAERAAQRDRPLVRALGAYIRLDAGIGTPRLTSIVEDLARSRSREGYGQYLLGMIAHHVGDRPKATAHLRAFLRRNAAIDRVKLVTLREELHRARRVLADLALD